MVGLGYVEANKGNQIFEVALNMRYLVAALYSLSAVMQFIGLGLVYNLDKKRLAKMTDELAQRRLEASGTPVA
jgi:GPH family glycoside/pentoside/hexuronide:cation symporter